MPFLSPAKLLVILVVALIVLGPDKLPKVAKQVGGLWHDLRRFRERMESEVRGTFPDLPSTERITQAVRSPMSFLNELADTHASSNDNDAAGTTSVIVEGGEDGMGEDGTIQPPGDTNRPAGTVRATALPTVSIAHPGGVAHEVRAVPGAAGSPAPGAVTIDDPGMN